MYIPGVPRTGPYEGNETQDPRSKAQLAPVVHGDAGVPATDRSGQKPKSPSHSLALRFAAREPVLGRGRHTAELAAPQTGDGGLVPVGVHTPVVNTGPLGHMEHGLFLVILVRN